MEKIPTFQDISSKFTQQIILGGRLIELFLEWNARAEAWYISIIDDVYELKSIRLVPNWLLFRQYKSSIPTFNGDIYVKQVDEEIGNEITYDNLNNGWDLFYLTDEEAESWEDLYGLG